MKYNSSGVEQWVARYNGTGNWEDYAYAIAVDDSGDVYVTGRSVGSGTFDDYVIIRYNSSGVKQWIKRYNGPVDSTDNARAIAIDGDGNVYVTGRSVGSGTGYDYTTIKYSSAVIEENYRLQIIDCRLEVYPNPFIKETVIRYSLFGNRSNVKLEIYDLGGKLVEETSGGVISRSVWIGKGLRAGIYFVKAKGYKPAKVVKLR
ncbi:unnamed protein product [marine sediment metagenome]|uniref:Secretion system C-terminal sorting domain-containing protein n=1 Tax=marine sediment metagenome TaxID=412755 RepID=X0X5J9_9ZZZZ